MSNQRGFVEHVVFAGLVALGFIPALEIGRAWWSPAIVAAAYFILTASAYVGWLGSSRSLRLGALTWVLAVGALCLLVDARLPGTAAALGGAVSVARARILSRQCVNKPWRVELLLALMSVAAVWFVAVPTRSGVALGAWAYWLVQSAYPLLVQHAEARRARAPADRFEAAVQRATELMDNLG